MPPVTVSDMDREHLRLIREGVGDFLARCGQEHARPGALLLDVAPQDHEGARPWFGPQVVIETLDIDPASGCTYIADLCRRNEGVVPAGRFDYVVCTEVLEHTRRPFEAAAELHRVLKPGGLLFLTVPFNFRIHGPLPDCWRFTEHGLREVLHQFHVERLDQIDTPGRDLMPVQYHVVARKAA
jgi:SAM-dependent methyltransferase